MIRSCERHEGIATDWSFPSNNPTSSKSGRMKVRFLARLIPAVLTPLILPSCHSGDPIGTGPPLPQWTTVSTGQLAYLSAVWGSSASDVWSVGGAGNAGVIIHYNGTAWANNWSSTSLGTAWFLGGVWGASPSDVWAVGATAG